MHSFALCFTLALIALFYLMPVGFSTVLFAFSLARSILRDRHHTKDCVEQGPKGFEFHRFPGKKVSGNTTIRKNEHLSCTKRASWRTDSAPSSPLVSSRQIKGEGRCAIYKGKRGLKRSPRVMTNIHQNPPSVSVVPASNKSEGQAGFNHLFLASPL